MDYRYIPRLFLAATIFLSGLQTAQAQVQKCPIDVTVTGPSKDNYVDDLLEVNVSLNNLSDEIQYLQYVPYPLHLSGAVTLRIMPPEGLKPSANLNGSGVGLITRLPAHRKLTIRAYLQRFLDGFHPGHYDIPWEVFIQCGESRTASAKGQLIFDITTAGSPNVQSKFAGLLARSEEMDKESRAQPPARGEGGVPIVDDDYQRQFYIYEAIEGLRVATSPLVIPFLEKLAGDFVWAKRVAYEGLMQFAAQPEARRFVLQSLQSSDDGDVYNAVQVLFVWGEHLPETEVEALLIKQKGHQGNQTSILSYMGRSQDAKYGVLIDKYRSDPNPAVAAAAKQAAAQIKR